jgi:hypothetical protein
MREDLLGCVFKKRSNLGPLLAIEIHLLSKPRQPVLDFHLECCQKGHQDCARCKEDAKGREGTFLGSPRLRVRG